MASTVTEAFLYLLSASKTEQSLHDLRLSPAGGEVEFLDNLRLGVGAL